MVLIGDSDLVMTSSAGGTNEEAVQEVLDLRASRGASLPGPHAGDFQEIPGNAWAFMVGEPPEDLQRMLVFRTLPRKVVFGVSGANNIEFQFHGKFATAAEAKAFADHITSLRDQAKGFLEHPPVKIKLRAAELLVGAVNQ